MRYRLIAALFVALFSSPAHAACTSPAGQESQTRYDFTAHKMLYCDGTDWVEMGGIDPGAGGGNPDFYITTNTYNGAQASTACTAGYHMCSLFEHFGRRQNTSLGTGRINWNYSSTTGVWVDLFAQTTASGDCNGWTSNSSSVKGAVFGLSNDTSLSPPVLLPGALSGSSTCNLSLPVMCCQD